MTISHPKTLAIIPSAGIGRRMGNRRKNYLTILGRPVLAHTLSAFEASPLIDAVVLVAAKEDIEYCTSEVVRKYAFRKVLSVVAGGTERQDSVRNGLEAAPAGYGMIAVHDGARPLVTGAIIDAAVRAARDAGAAIAAVPSKDTVKEVSAGFVRRTIPREALVMVQTPQAFRRDILEEAIRRAYAEGYTGTDEGSLVERTGQPVAVVEGSYENIKMTTPEDLLFAECILGKRTGGAP